jgi:hypothetical protein
LQHHLQQLAPGEAGHAMSAGMESTHMKA